MNNRTPHIVLVEDNDGDVYLFRQALASAGLNVELTVIEDGAEALAFARGEKMYNGFPVPDLAVLDLNLPKINGDEVLEALRKNSELSHVPVAIMSSSSVLRDQAKAKELGVVRFITKPPDFDEFLQIGRIIKELLQK